MFKFIFIFLISISSYSKGFIEPYIGTSFMGDFDYGKAAASAIQGKTNKMPLNIGGRLGFEKLGFIGGVEYSSTQDMDFDQNGTNQLGDLTEYGAFLGYDFPILVRGYIGYIVGGRMDLDTSGDFKKLSGPKLGVSIKPLPFVRINLEYKFLSFDTFTNTNPSNLQNIKDIDADLKMFTLTASIPLSLF